MSIQVRYDLCHFSLFGTYYLKPVYACLTGYNPVGFGQTSLSGVHRGFMPPQLKTKHCLTLYAMYNLSETEDKKIFP